MTGRTLEEIEALAAEATPGPWMHDAVEFRVLGAEKREVTLRTFSLTSGSRTPEQRKEVQANTNLAMSAPDLLAIAQGQREELDDLRSAVRFLAKMWSKTSWLRLEIIQALHNHNEDKAKALVTMQWPIVQGLQNQLDLEKVAEQKHETRRIRAAIDALLGIGTKK